MISDWSTISPRSGCMLWGFISTAVVFRIFYIYWQTSVLLTKSASTAKCWNNPNQDLNLRLQVNEASWLTHCSIWLHWTCLCNLNQKNHSSPSTIALMPPLNILNILAFMQHSVQNPYGCFQQAATARRASCKESLEMELVDFFLSTI